MRSRSAVSIFALHHSLVRCAFSEALQECRRHTLSLIAEQSADVLTTQSHPEFSPVGWHLGHIAYTESLWIAEHLEGLPAQFPTFLSNADKKHWQTLFAADGLPKEERQNLPELAVLLTYLETVRSHTLSHLSRHGTDGVERLWHWLIQHESQHAETMAMVLSMHVLKSAVQHTATGVSERADDSLMVQIETGEFLQGYDGPEAIDNERPAHFVWEETFWIDREPVSCSQYGRFIAAGGYGDKQWWSPQGWEWLQQAQVSAPLYWQQNCCESADTAVCGVSWYEADAYARFVGKRLPTESEWEKAVKKGEPKLATGDVWEWTDTWFDGYPGFRPFPYEGYSQVYFDGAHRVLKGGSWATPKSVRRESFRNWYHPHRREVFAGFRCAK
ncbi:MAG: SUMF1/EgtB/PvdO family nonheme iron enzyme [Cyanobacteria bacterium J06632_3]